MDMKKQNQKFNPWIFLIRSSSEDLLKKIPEIILKAKKTALEVGIAEKDVNKLIVMFDREGYSPNLFKEMWESRIACYTYRKYAKGEWAEAEFKEKDVIFPTGEIGKIKLAERSLYFKKNSTRI